MLREELREVGRYYELLVFLATGVTRVRELAKHGSIPESQIQYYLKQLIELGYVAKRYPLIEGRRQARTVRYVIDDALLRFLFANQSEIMLLTADEAFSELVAPQLESYWGSSFERMCRSALPGLARKRGEIPVMEIGEYWSPDVQIDVIALHKGSRIDIGECKWGQVKSWASVKKELERKVGHYPNPDGHSVKKWIFSRKLPPNSSDDGVEMVGLDDLYE